MNRGTLLLAVALLACSEPPQPDRTSSDSLPTTPPLPPPAPAADSGAPKLPPVDQADSSFRAFREQALHALARRDTAFLYGMLSPAIKNSFGPDDSIAGFKRVWEMAEPDRSDVWDMLARVLRMGGKLADSTFIAPYVFAFWPDSIDAFEHIAVISKRAPVYAKPAQDEPVIGTASYTILKVEDWDGEAFGTGPADWVRVRFPNGEQAWLHATDVYSPIDRRAFFERQDGRWTMLLFVAGD
jgi:hypothetical protein